MNSTNDKELDELAGFDSFKEMYDKYTDDDYKLRYIIKHCQNSKVDAPTHMYTDLIEALITKAETEARVEGMNKAKSRVLRRTEIPVGAKNPTRDAVVILGEEIADIIQGDIATLNKTGDKDE